MATLLGRLFYGRSTLGRF